MAEQLPGGFGQFIRESEAIGAARRSAEREQLLSEAINANQAFDKEARLVNAAELNTLSELRVGGSKGRELYHPTTGELIADKNHIIPGKIDSIRNDERFGATPKEREKSAQQYGDMVQKYLDKGYEPAQAELLADARVEDNLYGKPRLTADLIAAGKAPEDAERTVNDLFARRRGHRDKTVREHGFMTLQDYQTSEEGRKDSFNINQETLLASLNMQDRASQTELVNKLTNRRDAKHPRGLSLAEAQLKAKRLYETKDLARYKAIIENSIDSREAYDEYLKGRAPGNTAPPVPEKQPKPDNAETKEIPAVVDEAGSLAPEVDLRELRDIDNNGLRFTGLIAKRNANGGRLSATDEKEFKKLREKLNGKYPLENMTEQDIKDLVAEAGGVDFTRAELIRRIADIAETQKKHRELGLPTREGRLPLTGDKLYNMFAADSPAVQYYVGKGGLTPKMQQLLVELTKNKGTDVKLFHMEGFKPVLNPQTASLRRAKKIAAMTAEINAERKVGVKWEKNEATDKFEPKPSAELTGAGDLLLKQFMGNPEVSTNSMTKRARAARWIGRKLLGLQIPEYQPLPNGSERRSRAGLARHVGRIAGFEPQAESEVTIPTMNESGTPEEIAARQAYRARRQAELDANRARSGFDPTRIGQGVRNPEDDDES